MLQQPILLKTVIFLLQSVEIGFLDFTVTSIEEVVDSPTSMLQILFLWAENKILLE